VSSIGSCSGSDDDPCDGVDCGAFSQCDPNTGSCVCDTGYHLEGDECVEDETLEIAGSYTDDYGNTHEITGDTWTTMGSVFHITQFDNDQDFLVAQNDSANEYNPDLWSRFDWVFDGDSNLFYCQAAYAASSEQEALESTSADRGDLETGCGGFAWSGLN
jgi:hypothetical protein